jgi:hypothetical protein
MLYSLYDFSIDEAVQNGNNAILSVTYNILEISVIHMNLLKIIENKGSENTSTQPNEKTHQNITSNSYMYIWIDSN